jgi:hypothetical protein
VHFADKDEAAGSSPARPTHTGIDLQECSSAISLIAVASARRRRTAVLQRIPTLLSSDDYGSRVGLAGAGQVLWQLKAEWRLRVLGGVVLYWDLGGETP